MSIVLCLCLSDHSLQHVLSVKDAFLCHIFAFSSSCAFRCMSLFQFHLQFSLISQVPTSGHKPVQIVFSYEMLKWTVSQCWCFFSLCVVWLLTIYSLPTFFTFIHLQYCIPKRHLLKQVAAWCFRTRKFLRSALEEQCRIRLLSCLYRRNLFIT
jgi:hypothetical protein